jgi:RNA polymerase sigma-B factor
MKRTEVDWESIDEKIKIFRSQGLGGRKIGKLLKISASTIDKRITELGLPKAKTGGNYYQPSAEDKQKDILLSRLMAEGKTAKEIAIEFQVSVVTIHKRCKRLGLKFPKTIRVIEERAERDLLWREYSQNPNIANRNKLVDANLNLVRKIAHTFGNQAEYNDLVQEGTIGLIKAIEGFDTSLNFLFSSYAVPTIKGEMLHYFRDKYNPFKLRDKTVTCLSLDRNIRQAESNGSPIQLLDTIPAPEKGNMELMDLELAIDSMEDKYQSAVKLCYLQEIDRKTAAKILGVTPMTVTRYLERSISYLKREVN